MDKKKVDHKQEKEIRREMMKFALGYAEAGLMVLPVHGISAANGWCTCKKHKQCRNPGKHPRLKNWLELATRNPKEIEEWKYQTFNIGAATGARSGILVLDVDVKSGGFESLKKLIEEHEPLPKTARAVTGSGGEHIYFKYTEKWAHLKGKVAIRPGLDIRTNGGQVLLPPSFHFSGGHYAWEEHHELWRFEKGGNWTAGLPEIPEWLARIIEEPQPRRVGASKWEGPIARGERNDQIFKFACSLRGKGMDEDQILEEALDKNRIDCHPPLDESEVEKIVQSALNQPAGSGFITIKTSAGDTGIPNPRLPHNVIEALSRMTDFQLWYDEFAGKQMVRGKTMTDLMMNHIRHEMDRRFSFFPSKELLISCLDEWMYERRRHPVREYLEKVQWDGERRIDRWLIDLCGARDNELNRAYGRAWLIGAVRRILHPGSKFDPVLTLVGDQGTYKSTALAELAVCGEWFTDNAQIFGKTQWLMEDTAGKWIVELSDLGDINRAKVGRLRRVLSSQKDVSRMAYDRYVSTKPRESVFIATVNPDQAGFLQEIERRFWVVPTGNFIDPKKVRAVRDQLWAEAVDAEARGEEANIPPELWEKSLRRAKVARQIDPWENKLADMFAETKGWVSSAECLDLLGVEVSRQSSGELRRVCRCLRGLGFRDKGVKRVDGERKRVHVRGGVRYPLTEDQKMRLIDGIDWGIVQWRDTF